MIAQQSFLYVVWLYENFNIEKYFFHEFFFDPALI